MASARPVQLPMRYAILMVNTREEALLVKERKQREHTVQVWAVAQTDSLAT
jgi:hypothetical protein